MVPSTINKLKKGNTRCKWILTIALFLSAVSFFGAFIVGYFGPDLILNFGVMVFLGLEFLKGMIKLENVTINKDGIVKLDLTKKSVREKVAELAMKFKNIPTKRNR